MNSNTEVIIVGVKLMDLDEVLLKVKKLKRENPNTKFHIEVSL